METLVVEEKIINPKRGNNKLKDDERGDFYSVTVTSQKKLKGYNGEKTPIMQK
jgi:hypothetical protein